MPEYVELCKKTGNWKRNNRPIKDWHEQTKANAEMIKYRVPLCPEMQNLIG
ncbi:uncharacterized protein METZ01_LOCUS470778 [marine metagenome]|uniref:Uncharacterized protein n=1 Tax=marine metagenome TaxID=408172 RepID=A0A383BDH3_9ZZZZ